MNPDDSQRPGRDGLLRLVFERRGDATILRRCRYTLPLQVLSPLTLDDGTCYLPLLNPTGGVLGGDRFHTEVVLEQGSRVCLSTPSAARVYRTSGAPAEMHTVLRVGGNSTLEYFPDHLIPHPGSSLRQSLRVEMGEGSRGIFFDGFAAGRIALGERWLLRDFDSRTEIFLRGQPIFMNRTRIVGASSPHLSQVIIPSRRSAEDRSPERSSASEGALLPLPDVVLPSERGESRDLSACSLSARGRMADYAYSGSLVIVADKFGDWRQLVEKLRIELDAVAEVFGGASLLAHCGCSVRYVTYSAIEFHAATERLWILARLHLLALPPLALRKY